MSVHVSRFNTCLPDFSDLGSKFRFDIGCANSSGACSCYESSKSLGQSAIGSREGWNLLRRRDGYSARQHQVASDSQFWIGFGAPDRIVEGRSVGHQRRARQYSFAVGADDPFIDSARQPEIVGVENYLLHLDWLASLSRQKCYHVEDEKF